MVRPWRISGPGDHGFGITVGKWSFMVLFSKSEDEVKRESTADVAADALQAMADDPELAREVWYRLEDRTTLAQSDLQQSLAEWRRGEVIPLGKDAGDDLS